MSAPLWKQLTEAENEFISQHDEFIQRLTGTLNERPPQLVPTVIHDWRSVSTDERESLAKAFHSTLGVAAFVVTAPPTEYSTHPLLALSDQLKHECNTSFPLEHPLEAHPETVRRFGRDGTLKIYDNRKASGYREQGETSDAFELHNDGLGSGGTVRTAAFYLDSPPLRGGTTYFLNVASLAGELFRNDPDAFRSLFLPDVVTYIRPRGKGALSVTGPVLYLNELSDPQVNFRRASGEYQVEWRQGIDAVDRARRFLTERTTERESMLSTITFSAQGHGCFVRNEQICHGRTAFVNSPGSERVLARKWFMRTDRDSAYKHVPGLFVDRRFASLFPERFSDRVLEGEWTLESGINIRRK